MYILDQLATDSNFDETQYLLANPDVARAVHNGSMESALIHFKQFGRKEGRRLRLPYSIISESKQKKLKKIESLLRKDIPCLKTNRCYDFLTEELRSQFNIIDTDTISTNGYDQYAMDIIKRYEHGMILDCGAGRRPVYFDNVVNFEIVDFDTTDVRGVGEVLPFIDASFDAVISIAVLEHVKDPFLCAREIERVLKPGGDIMCCVPFLQPFHGCPHHYYNMSHEGLKNLFSFSSLEIEKIDVYSSVLPIWALTWIIKSWADGLEGKTKQDFLNLKICDLMEPGNIYVDKPFVQELSVEKNLELACATVLFAHKKKDI